MQTLISEKEYLMGRDKEWPINETVADNMKVLLARVHLLILVHKPELKPLFNGITSGYRPAAFNKTVKGAASKSAHITCEAVDLRDDDGSIARILRADESVLKKAGLFMEHPSYTKGWVHLQTRPTKSNKPVFIPY